MSDDERKSMAEVEAKRGAKGEAQAGTQNKPPEDKDPMMTDQVTYLPGPEDPPQVKFGGHTFNANLSKKVDMPTSYFERLQTNKFFKVGHFDAVKDSVPAQEQSEPKTADEYKVYAVEWFKKTQSLKAFDERWTEEEGLRQDCEVGAEELDYLSSLARPKRAELKKKLRP
jgi:hypothetical protein